ncbi:MAG: hypothetical protein KBC84_02725 [Proteobacteria bacterium]|nr:hypothetical protein [Pseudomonadota bacterium]
MNLCSKMFLSSRNISSLVVVLFLFICQVFFVNLKFATASNELPIFPGASGFGTTTVAGSGRHLSPAKTNIYHVNTLADSGVGSLRSCVEAKVVRTCIFDVSGIINLKKALAVKSPYLTIAGQSAPAPGILISGAGIQVSAHDVLIQHLQIRVGDDLSGSDPETRDGLAIAALDQGVYNVVIDRVSISWAIDENLSTYSIVNDVTISNSVISESLWRSIHPKGPHGMGFLVGNDTKRISIHNNLFAHNNERNPRFNPGVEAEFANNIVYNWGGKSGWYLANLSDTLKTENPVRLNFIGNYYLAGANSTKQKSINASDVASLTRVYVKDNIDPFRTSLTDDEWLVSSINKKFRSNAPALELSNFQATDALTNYSNVLNNAGARISESNAVDERVKADVLSRTGSIKDCVSGCQNSAGGYPFMPLIIKNAELPDNPNDDDNSNGYTNLEDWLHWQSFMVQDLNHKTQVPSIVKPTPSKKSKKSSKKSKSSKSSKSSKKSKSSKSSKK